MLIKESSGNKNGLFDFVLRIIKNNKITVLLVLFVIYSSALFFLGAYLYKSGIYGNVILPVIVENYKIPINYIKSFTIKPQELIIDIKHKNFQKLAHRRKNALQHDLFVNKGDYVPGKIRYNKKTYKVNLRLKGDHTDHLQGEKWSYRIKVKGDHTIFGMKKFSIHHPKTRNYLYEWIFHHALKKEDILSLRYKFVHVIINGRDLGVYALEEHFDKRLIEYNQRREGPIIRFNEDLMWSERLQYQMIYNYVEKSGYGSFLSSDIDAFQTKKIMSDAVARSNFIKAVGLLEAFRRGDLKTSDVFDIEKLSKYFAITDLMGAEHATLWFNMRFYYNPVTSFLEPIGFDGNSGTKITNLVVNKKTTRNYHLYELIFKDEKFIREYIKALECFSDPAYLDSLLMLINNDLQKNLKILYREFPHYGFNQHILYQNQRFIKTMLHPGKGLHAYFKTYKSNRIVLELGNIQTFPLKIIHLSYKDSNIFKPESIIKLALPEKNSSESVNYQAVSFLIPDGSTWSKDMIKDLKVHYKIIGATGMQKVPVFSWPYLHEDFIKHDFIRQLPNIFETDFLKVDAKHKKIFFKPGEWDLKENLIIPKGFKVIAGEGLKLNLLNSANILSFSPIIFGGLEDRPILIHSSDSTGQGIVIMNAQHESVLEFVQFENLSNPSQGGWELTGAVTFHESPVKMRNCRFMKNRSEDALNIIRTEFMLNNTLFEGNKSDSFDADFCKGRLINSVFSTSGNDAFDISGSVVDIENITIDGAGDKGISVGENSKMIADQIHIQNAAIAVACKDMSDTVMNGVNINNSTIGFTAYQKKSEFGSASIIVSDLKMDNVDIPYLIEKESVLTVDGRLIKSDKQNIKEVMYGKQYGKSSK